MSWVRVMTAIITHAKQNEASTGFACDPLGLWLAGLCWAHQNKTDGRIPRHMLPVLRPTTRKAGVAAAALVEVGLWEETDDGWRIHDYLDYQQSSEEIREISEKRAAAGRKGGTAKRNDSVSSESKVVVKPERLDRARVKVRRESEERIFAAWVKATDRTPQTVFDDRRRRVVEKALKLMPFDDVLDAVRGVRHSEHHMSNRQWSELKVVLRDAGQIEAFRDLEREYRRAPSGASGADVLAAIERTAA